MTAKEYQSLRIDTFNFNSWPLFLTFSEIGTKVIKFMPIFDKCTVAKELKKTIICGYIINPLA